MSFYRKTRKFNFLIAWDQRNSQCRSLNCKWYEPSSFIIFVIDAILLGELKFYCLNLFRLLCNILSHTRALSAVGKFNQLVYNYPIRIPERFSLVIRSLLTQEGICFTLKPDFKFLEVKMKHSYLGIKFLTVIITYPTKKSDCHISQVVIHW